ncbi:NTP transferase domain-containing protein [Candidatus Uhrbacteria bacterium]|nr:NTP transferase domain-containing protein [Candidatus Uhrbacteria bacterium]
MQAVLLAAGEGTRLRPLTEDRPKPMVSIAGKPILEYTLSILPKAIDEIIMITGYKGEKIREYFGDSFRGLPIIYVEQAERKGTADAIEKALPYLNGEYFMVVSGDDLYHPDDLEQCVIGTQQTLLVKETDEPQRFGICLVGKDDLLEGLVEKPKDPPSNLANVGVYVLHQDIFKIPKIIDEKGEHVLAPKIGELAKIRPTKVIRAQFWHPVGYPEDIETGAKYLEMSHEDRKN